MSDKSLLRAGPVGSQTSTTVCTGTVMDRVQTMLRELKCDSSFLSEESLPAPNWLTLRAIKISLLSLIFGHINTCPSQSLGSHLFRDFLFLLHRKTLLPWHFWSSYCCFLSSVAAPGLICILLCVCLSYQRKNLKAETLTYSFFKSHGNDVFHTDFAWQYHLSLPLLVLTVSSNRTLLLVCLWRASGVWTVRLLLRGKLCHALIHHLRILWVAHSDALYTKTSVYFLALPSSFLTFCALFPSHLPLLLLFPFL